MTPNTRSSRPWWPSAGRSDVARSPAAVRQARSVRKGERANLAPETLTEQAYRLIEERIVTLRLKPGDVISEQILSATFKIGRTPIREALQRLTREGLIIVLPRKGILVSDINPRNQLLVLEVRREIERLLSRAGAERANQQQRDQFTEIAQGMDRAAKSNDDLAFIRPAPTLTPPIIQPAPNNTPPP